MTMVELAAWLVAIVTILTLLWKGAMMAATFLTNTYRFWADFASMPETVAKLSKEVMPNGGQSLSDVVRATQKQLAVVEQRGVAWIEESPRLMFQTDENGHFVFVNRAFKLKTGFTNEALGVGWINVVTQNERMDVFKRWREAVDQEREFIDVFSLVDARGSSVQVQCHAYPMRDRGTLIGYFGSLKKKEDTLDA